MTYNIEQPTGAGAAGEGRALDGAWVDHEITISGDPTMTEFEHSFRDKPLSSSAVMLDASERVARFTPDVAGDTYRVRLRERLGPTAVWQTTTKVIRVTKDADGNVVNYGIVSVAFEELPSEADYASNERGYAQRETANNAAIVAALDNPWKRACVAVSTSPIALTGLQTIDGVIVTEGARVLVNGQTDRATNGIYVASAFAWTRASDMTNAAALLGTTVRVLESSSDLVGWWTLSEPTSGPVEIGTTEIEFALIGGFVLPEEDIPWSPSDMTGIKWWDDPNDTSLVTLTGARIDTLQNKLGGSPMVRSAGTPTRDVTAIRNGKVAMRNDATTELSVPAGGPVGDSSWWIVTVTNGDSAVGGGWSRVGAKAGDGALGVTAGGFFGAGRPAVEGLPRVESPLPDGNVRIVQGYYLAPYGLQFAGFDGALQTSGSNWYLAQADLALDGSMAHGNSEVAGNCNTSARWMTCMGEGVPSGGDMVRLTNYLTERFALPRTAPNIRCIGDSISTSPATSPATISWFTKMVTDLNAQLTIDGRTNLTSSRFAQAGKFLGGAWNGSNPPMLHNLRGDYPAAFGTLLNTTTPWLRSGRREYEILVIGTALTNDYINGNISSDEAIARLDEACRVAMAQGHYVVLGTTIPGWLNAGWWSTTREANRVVSNNWIKTQALALGRAHAIIDWEAGGLLYGDGTTYFSGDAVHPNDAGMTLMANIARAVVYDLIINTIDSPIGALAE